MKNVTMQDAIDAGNGTLHGAIDYWQKRALNAEIELEAFQCADETTRKLANNYIELTCTESNTCTKCGKTVLKD